MIKLITVKSIRVTVLLILTIITASCGGPGDTENEASLDSSVKLLEGNDTASASDMVIDFSANDLTSEDEISIDANGSRIDRTNLSIAFTQFATVGDVNVMLQSINGSIVDMLPGVDILLVKIPDPGNLDALDAIVQQLQVDPIVQQVNKAYMADSDALPANIDIATANILKIDHQLATLAPAAWNARAALDNAEAKPPLLLVGDFFGGGLPNADFNINALNSNDFSDTTIIPDNFFFSSTPSDHGYHVLGIITGRHSENASETSPTQLVTGMYPGMLDVRVVDYLDRNIPNFENKMLRIINNSSQNVVVNTSIEETGGCAKSTDGSTERPCSVSFAKQWLKKVRGTIAYNLGEINPTAENKFLHLTSAGNFDSTIPLDNYAADVTSGWTAASLNTGMMTSLPGVPIANMTNTVVVVNRFNNPIDYTAGCDSQSSKLGGQLSGIGEDVWSFGSAEGTSSPMPNGSVPMDLTGTSMSTPQVAGLAAYVWALNPDLKSDEVADLLIKTVQNPNTCNGVAPVIDAYAAVLAAVDDSAALVAAPDQSAALAPVRNAILDTDDNGVFDEADVEAYAQVYLSEKEAKRDFTRLDLNGDGFIGGTGTARFNLDIDENVTYEAVSQAALGLEFDENQLSDTEILCYYAYSPLFQGDGEKRDEILVDACVPGKIYYGRFDINVGNVSIFSMDADGANQTQLVDGEVLDSDIPRVSRDGQKLAFAAKASGSSDRDDIYVINTDGSGLLNITNSPTENVRNPEWSPDGSKIAFSNDRTGIHIINSDGTDLQIIVPDINSGRPYWSPDGQKLLFQRITGSGFNRVHRLYTIKTDGSAEKLITNTGNNLIYHYQWSPDGSKILYSLDAELAADPDTLYVIDSDGANLTSLTVMGRSGSNYPFDWSPDGSQIAFEADGAGGDLDVFIMDADGSNIINVTNTTGHDYQPQWGSTGLLYARYNDGGFTNIFRTSLDGSVQRNLTNSGFWEVFNY